jgi:hypothetical protein
MFEVVFEKGVDLLLRDNILTFVIRFSEQEMGSKLESTVLHSGIPILLAMRSNFDVEFAGQAQYFTGKSYLLTWRTSIQGLNWLEHLEVMQITATVQMESPVRRTALRGCMLRSSGSGSGKGRSQVVLCARIGLMLFGMGF